MPPESAINLAQLSIDTVGFKRSAMSVREISTAIERRVRETLLDRLPRGCDGRHHFTFFGRCMPLEWLWTSDALLPAVVANGAMRLNKTVVELLPDDHTILGYVLAEPAPFQPEMVDAALELIRCEPHHMYCPGMPGHLTDGQHLEVMYFVSKDGFWEPVQAQGLKPKFVSLKVFETLKIKFLETGINSWIT